MFESPNTQPHILQHHRRHRAGSSQDMFESPNTQPRVVPQYHRRLQANPATIVPRASSQLINLAHMYFFVFNDSKIARIFSLWVMGPSNNSRQFLNF